MSKPSESRDASTPGTKPKYHPDLCRQAGLYAAKGATDIEIADFLQIDPATLYRWRNTYDEFRIAIAVGKEPADDRVERAAFENCIGYYYTEDSVQKVKVGRDLEEVQIVKVQKFKPGDTVAQIFWLKSRKREIYGDKSINDVPFTPEQLAAMAPPETPKADEDGPIAPRL